MATPEPAPARIRSEELEAHPISDWLPMLQGVVQRLEQGGKVADVGCGLGAATLSLARAFPRSIFVGFAAHAASVELARERAEHAGVADRVRFEVARATDFPGSGYDLVAHFDGLHELGDPVGAARLAAQGREMRLRQLILEGGFSRFRQAAQTPFHRVFEARA